MKHTLLIITALMLVVGCSSPEPINYEETLNKRDGVFYTKDTNEPYSGQVFSLYDDGKKKEEGTIKDGRKDGEWTEWHYNGQKKLEGTYKDGKEDGVWTWWYENGQKRKEGILKNWRSDGLTTAWYENGQKWYEVTFKDGKRDGLSTTWYENGRKRFETTYKDGELIEETYWDEDGNKEQW